MKNVVFLVLAVCFSIGCSSSPGGATRSRPDTAGNNAAKNASHSNAEKEKLRGLWEASSKELVSIGAVPIRQFNEASRALMVHGIPAEQGDGGLGMVIVQVPREHQDRARKELSTYSEENGLKFEH